MRLLKTQALKPGMRLGKSIFNDRGTILLVEGCEISDKIKQRLLSLDVSFVYVQDERTKDIKAESTISNELRRSTVKTIENIFLDVRSMNIHERSFVIEGATQRFSQLLEDIITEIKSSKRLLTLLADVYIHDDYIFTHSMNVTLYTLAIAKEMKMKPKQMTMLGLGAILHDVGKMLVSPDILKKPVALSEEEYSMIKQHSEFGFQLLRKIHSVPLLVAHCAYQHHERLDGSGYPRGLCADNIHYFAKIIAVADVFDAITSNRIYRQAMLPHEALEILYAGSGTQFETKIIEAFRRSVTIYPDGLTVQLNDGRKGVVSSQNVGLSDRPILLIIEEDGIELEHTYTCNLKDHNHLLITSCLVDE